MKISNDEVLKALSQQRTDGGDRLKQQREALEQALDEAKNQFSDTAFIVREVRRKLDEMPDVREELVEDLKRRIAEGSYNPSPDDIADLMIRRSLADKIR